jgi:RNA polymerase sigma factor (sigma-70 family)
MILFSSSPAGAGCGCEKGKMNMNTQNEKKRLAEFFRTDYQKLLWYVKQRVDDIAAQDAEDFIHDVAVSLFDRADVGLPIEHLSAYVYRSLKNRMIDYFRSRRPMMALEESGMEFDTIKIAGKSGQVGYGPDSGMRQVEISHDLSSLMAGLKDNEKQLIIATEIKGKTFNQLARKWDVPINTLLSRKSRAMAKLRREISYSPT